MRRPLHILQIATTLNDRCGIGYFSKRMATALRRAGAKVKCSAELRADRADIVFLHYHGEVLPINSAHDFIMDCRQPVVLMPHSDDARALYDSVAAIVAMVPSLIEGAKRGHWFPHPSETFSENTTRRRLRTQFGLPLDRFLIGTNGFLRYEREYPRISEAILHQIPAVAIYLVLSPWKQPSPGVLEELASIAALYPSRLHLAYSQWSNRDRFDRLRACDLLWCWTAAPSSPYASGVVSDQYASGTQMVVVNKLQHSHILGLPNVVTTPEDTIAFIGALAEASAKPCVRHDPSVIAWGEHMPNLLRFLESL